MSRVANSPVALPSGVEVKLMVRYFREGCQGRNRLCIHDLVELVQEKAK